MSSESHAEQLHKERPEIYKDPNHKPEMAIALTSFQALCGFRPVEQIVGFFQGLSWNAPFHWVPLFIELPELRKVVKEENVCSFVSTPSEELLKKCFSALMNAPKDEVSSALEEMTERFGSLDNEDGSFLLKDLFLTLHNQYPGDVGCFSIYLLNYIILQPGEALFLGPNIIHAYLLGDCMECMACSDNVVRAGLTPKYQDVDTLLAMLEYDMRPSESRKFYGFQIDDNTTLFNPPFLDFAVQKIQSKNEKNVSLTQEDSASIFIVINGKGSSVSVSPFTSAEIKSPEFLKRGSVLFVEAGQQLCFRASSDFLAFRALCL